MAGSVAIMVELLAAAQAQVVVHGDATARLHPDRLHYRSADSHPHEAGTGQSNERAARPPSRGRLRTSTR